MFHPTLFIIKVTALFGLLIDRWQQLWQWLTEPAATVTEPDDRRQARLLAGLLVCLLPTTFLASLTPLTGPDVVPWPNEEFYVAMIALVFLGVAYALSRTRRFVLAAGLMVVVMAAAILGLVASFSNLGEINYYIGLMILPLLVSSLFLSPLSTLAIIGFSLGTLLLLPFLTPISLPEIIIGPLSFVLLISIFILILTRHRNLLERDRQTRLAQSEERLRLALAAAEMGIWDWNTQTHQIAWSEGVERLFGLGPADFSPADTTFFDIIYPQDRQQFFGGIEKAAADGSRFIVEYRVIWPDNTLRWMSSLGKVISYNQANPSRLLGTIHDITARKNLETRLQESQRMDMVGQMAGGIAHDFNNLLTVITGYTSLALDYLDPRDPLHSNLLQVNKAGERAARLTAQLLAFSRRQVLQPQLLSLNELALNLEKMLNHLIGEAISLELILQPDLDQVKADPSQLEQVILHLVVNARDAMPEGGKIVVKTTNVELTEFYTDQYTGLKPGAYVMLMISDTGVGMDAETQSHIFEPFFTTKEPGQGTGLGLSMVYGTIKQSDGHIGVYSEPGHGTTFKLYLPRSSEVARAVSPDPEPAAPADAETILLVEDEEAVRQLITKVLVEIGYKILQAADGNQALAICEHYSGDISLLITDIIMPGGMNGRQLADQLVQQRSHLKVLYVSGYTNDIVIEKGLLDHNAEFLEKPFNLSALISKVRAVLAAG